MSLYDSLQSLSHHAYLLIGGDPVKAELVSILEKNHKIRARGNPDFSIRTYETFTIDDARELKSSAGTRPVGSEKDSGRGKKVFIIQMNAITVEAQNALLKLLEEPPEYAHFFLLVPSAHLLLPTVKSRLSAIDDTLRSAIRQPADTGKDSRRVPIDAGDPAARSFLKMSPPKRLEFIKKLLDDVSKEKKTKQDAIDFLNAVQSVVYKDTGVKKGMRELRSIETARKYMNDRAPSLKMLLEYVALSV